MARKSVKAKAALRPTTHRELIDSTYRSFFEEGICDIDKPGDMYRWRMMSYAFEDVMKVLAGKGLKVQPEFTNG